MKKVGIIIIGLFMAAIIMINVSVVENVSGTQSRLSLNALKRAIASSPEGDDDWTCNQPVKDSCKFTVTIDMDLGKLKDWLGFKPSIGATVDLTDLTQLYSKGGKFRCGNDVTCNSFINSL